ncbi:hypothetical protein EJB05_15655, partial [Eragrostis curvula]
MTINKCQGQTLGKVGVYLREPVFTHGQLYVVFSRDTIRILDRLIEDKVYYIESFEVTNPRPSYRPVRHPYMAKFTRYTNINECPAVSDTFPLYACDIVPFTTLLSRIDEIDYLSYTRTGRRVLHKIYITDGSETDPVTLWKEHAYRFEDEQIMSMSKQGPVAILLIGLTARWHEAWLQLQGSPTCMWYINPAIPQAVALQERYCLSLLGVEPGALEDANAPNIDLVCFGPTTEQLIGAPVLALLDAGGNAEGFIPPSITRCFGRQYQFRLSLPQTALGRDRPSFKIDAIETIPAIVLANNVPEQT